MFQAAPEIETRVLAGLAATTVPVPRLLAADPTGTVIGDPWFAMELVRGTGLPDEPSTGYAQRGWFAQATPELRATVWNAFVDILADLHRLPAATFGPAPRGGSHGAMLEFWAASLHDTMSPGVAKVQERALGWLRDNAPADADETRGPCMGDARYWGIYAATFMAVTTTRAFRIIRGTAEADIERLHPSLPDLERLLDAPRGG